MTGFHYHNKEEAKPYLYTIVKLLKDGKYRWRE